MGSFLTLNNQSKIYFLREDGKPMSKKGLKKMQKEAEKLAKKAEKQAAVYFIILQQLK